MGAWWRVIFLEGSAKRVFLKGAAKLCFSLICGKLLGKCHFQGFVFAASYRGNCNFGGFYLQQAFRKLSGKYHLQGLLLQAIGDIQFSGVHFQQALGNFAFATCSDAASSWETIGKIPCKLLGTSHFKGLPLLQALWTTRFVTFSCAASYIGQEGNCNWQGCICTKPVGNLICRLLVWHEVTRGFRFAM